MSFNSSILHSFNKEDPSGELVQFLVENFKKVVPTRIEQFVSYLNSNSLQEAIQEIHAVKNTFANVGGEGAAQFCQSLEDQLREGKAVEIKGVSKELNQHFLSVSTSIAQIWN